MTDIRVAEAEREDPLAWADRESRGDRSRQGPLPSRGGWSKQRLAVGSLLVLVLTGCGTSDGGGGAAASETVTVYAAASLSGVFDRLAEEFESAHPGVDVKVDYAGSADLVQRVLQGAPVDVLATADERTMTTVTEADPLAGNADIFATNRLALVVPPDNPAGIESLEDLQREGVKLVQCAPRVPCGAAADKVADSNGVVLHPVSQENSVTDVLGKVITGQADAGLVYVTDARSAGEKIKTLNVPHAEQAVNRYPVVTFEDSPNPGAAQDFVELLTGDQGRDALHEVGFGIP